jgi:hypothetical protein
MSKDPVTTSLVVYMACKTLFCTIDWIVYIVEFEMRDMGKLLEIALWFLLGLNSSLPH